MSANRWKEIRYNRVSSVCMNNNMALFYSHDPEGFEKYLTDVELGQKTISGATLLPHEQAICGNGSDPYTSYGDGPTGRLRGPHTVDPKRSVAQKVAEVKGRVVGSQWRTIIERLRESGSIENATAICDVS